MRTSAGAGGEQCINMRMMTRAMLTSSEEAQTMPDRSPRVSVVVLNFNGAGCLDDCLDSLVSQTENSMEVVVADNGSHDASAQVAAKYPVRWEPLGRNHGFARGNNIAARMTSGAVLLFVNNDMRFHADFVERLVYPLTENPDYFATDARQFDWEGANEIHLATRLRPRSLLSAARPGQLLPLLAIEQVGVDGPTEVVQACASALAVRRWMFDELGGFDDRFPADWEDTDLCWRAWLRGWRTVYIPQAVCWHRGKVASSSREGRPVRERGALGGRLLFSAKHLPSEGVAMAWLLAIAGGLRDLALLRMGKVARRAALLLECARETPRTIRDRRRTYRSFDTSPRRHLAFLRSIPTKAP
jgi:GT2 family glycosyltransferase